MNEHSQAFIQRLAAVSPQLEAAFQGTIEYWEPETPPVTIAFGELGQSVVENYQSLGSDRIQAIMAIVEEGMNSADEELSTAVATGFIEAVVNRESNVQGGLATILSDFGKESRSYAEAWVNG